MFFFRALQTLSLIMSACFLDCRGFNTDRGFIFKEIAVLCTRGRLLHVWTFRPPCPRRQLPFADLRAVHATNIGLTWEDGTVPYNALESVFVTIAREFRHWIVASEETKALASPYKSLSVHIEVRPLKQSPLKKGETHSSVFLKCIYDHSECAIATISKMFDQYHQPLQSTGQ